MSVALATLVLLAPAAVAPRAPQDALAEAVSCYEELDYECAEARLAETLAGDLAPVTMARARLYEALLAVAWRDLTRARRAVAAIMAIDPRFEPGPLPAQLAQIFNEERPPPVPPPHPMVRFDATRVVLFGQDGARWNDARGVAVGAGLLVRDEMLLELGFWASAHESTAFANDGTALEDLSLWAVDVGGLWWIALGPLRVALGGRLGLGRMDLDSPLRPQDAWLTFIASPLEVSWPVWAGLGLGVRMEPTLLLRSEDDTIRSSYLLPVTVGLRYGK